MVSKDILKVKYMISAHSSADLGRTAKPFSGFHALGLHLGFPVTGMGFHSDFSGIWCPAEMEQILIF